MELSTSQVTGAMVARWGWVGGLSVLGTGRNRVGGWDVQGRGRSFIQQPHSRQPSPGEREYSEIVGRGSVKDAVRAAASCAPHPPPGPFSFLHRRQPRKEDCQ